MRKDRWVQYILLLLILVIALILRLHGLTRYSIWRDESWAVYLATGRGDLLFGIPFQQVVEHPPNLGFNDAPHWWHIWNTLDGVAHPPGYYVGLRWWIDLFGESDYSIRVMSVLFGVAGIVVLFDAMRVATDPWRGLTAAALMALAPMQVDFSQQARPYTLATCVCLLIYDLLLRTEKNGISRGKVVWIGAFVALALLIHYFVLGIVLGAAIYAFTRLDGKARRQVITAIAIGAAFVAIVWGPFIPQSRGAFHNALGTTDPRAHLALSTLDVPQRLLFNEVQHPNWFISSALAVLIYLLPLLDRRKLIWWLWVVLSLACVLWVDILRHSVVMQIDRYIFLAGAGVYALAAMPLARKVGQIVPPVILLCAVVAAAGRYEVGPAYSPGSVYIWEEDRYSAAFLKNRLQPGDIVVVTDNIITYAEWTFWATAHYNGQWKVPIVLVKEPINAKLQEQLMTYDRVWVIGQFPVEDTKRLLPGCNVIDVGGTVAFDSVWRIK
jgi:hypothetical protein